MSANVLSTSIGFHTLPSKDSPGFGFGFGSTTTMPAQPWPSAPFQSAQSSAFNHLASTSFFNTTTHRAQKRRHEPEESENHPQDEVMDRSPTPERPKRAAPKRLRTTPSDSSIVKDDAKDSKPKAAEDKDVDIGLLLATLPPQSLLPILTALIKSNPSLKSAILPLIPRPTVEAATQALAESSRKLREAYPYSNNTASVFSQSQPTSTSFGFGFGVAGPSSANGGAMRDSYIQSRLRPHINDFVAICTSYLPYFSYRASHSQSGQNKQPHPTEVFYLLSNLTAHILSHPPLTQSGLESSLLSRVSDEWSSWVVRVDEFVNQEGGMFGSETVQNWIQRLDEFAAKDSQFGQAMRGVRDQWVARVGWLVGRSNQRPMLT